MLRFFIYVSPLYFVKLTLDNIGYILYNVCIEVGGIMNFDVILFETKDGTCPVSDFINSLDVKMKSKVLRMIGLLGKNGNELREPYTKYLKDGIFELRVQQGNDLSRVLYFFKSGQKIIMTNGFIKKTQKTPVNEIALAKRYMAEYDEYVREGKRK